MPVAARLFSLGLCGLLDHHWIMQGGRQGAQGGDEGQVPNERSRISPTQCDGDVM